MPRTNQTTYNFKEVTQPQRSPRQYKRLPKRTIRLRPSGISISKDVAARFPMVPFGEGRTDRTFLKIEMDVKKKVIRLSFANDGYSFQVWPKGNASLSTLPRDFKANRMPLGDYTTNNQNNVFKFVA